MRYAIQNIMTGRVWNAPAWEAMFWANTDCYNVYRLGGSGIPLCLVDIAVDIQTTRSIKP